MNTPRMAGPIANHGGLSGVMDQLGGTAAAQQQMTRRPHPRADAYLVGASRGGASAVAANSRQVRRARQRAVERIRRRDP